MIEAISTGKNSCYGKKGEVTRFCNQNLEFVMINKLVKVETIKFLPTWYQGKKTTPKERAKLVEVNEKKVYVHNQIMMIAKAHKRIEKEIEFIKKKQTTLIKLLREKDES